jgi:hypothetical protein
VHRAPGTTSPVSGGPFRRKRAGFQLFLTARRPALRPVLDDLEWATVAAERAGDAGPLTQGLELVRTMFLDVLRRHRITPVKAVGQPFDRIPATPGTKAAA